MFSAGRASFKHTQDHSIAPNRETPPCEGPCLQLHRSCCLTLPAQRDIWLMVVEEGQPTPQRCYPAERVSEEEVLGKANGKNADNKHHSVKLISLHSQSLICLHEQPTLSANNKQ